MLNVLATLVGRDNFNTKKYEPQEDGPRPTRWVASCYELRGWRGGGVGGGGGKETHNTFSSFSCAIFRHFFCFKIICNRPYSSCSSSAEQQTILLAHLFWQLTPQPNRECSFVYWPRSRSEDAKHKSSNILGSRFLSILSLNKSKKALCISPLMSTIPVPAIFSRPSVPLPLLILPGSCLYPVPSTPTLNYLFLRRAFKVTLLKLFPET